MQFPKVLLSIKQQWPSVRVVHWIQMLTNLVRGAKIYWSSHLPSCVLPQPRSASPDHGQIQMTYMIWSWLASQSSSFSINATAVFHISQQKSHEVPWSPYGIYGLLTSCQIHQVDHRHPRRAFGSKLAELMESHDMDSHLLQCLCLFCPQELNTR